MASNTSDARTNQSPTPGAPTRGQVADSVLSNSSDWQRTVNLLNFIFAPMQGLDGTGRPFGRFTLRRELGRGGFGKVFLADDPENDGPFALKVANESTLESASRLARFLSEGRLLAGLDHPNLVPFYESGAVDGIGFLRIHFCDGPNLRAWLAAREQPPKPRCSAAWLVQLADAVAYAHRKGIVHRDLKPSNVLFETDAAYADNDSVDRWRLRIADFGLARLVDDSDRTQSGDVIGTPGYLSPEQAEGKSSIGPAVDIWGLGTILYELLTGVPAFGGRTDLEKLRRLMEAAPTPPRRLNPEVPASLETICLRCLESNPRLRYESATALRDDLQRFLDGRPLHARPLNVVARAVRWVQRRPIRAAAIALALVIMPASAIGYALHRSKVREALRIADQEAVERRSQSAKLQKIEHFNRVQSAYRKLLAGQPNEAFELLAESDRFADSFECRHLKWLATGCGRAVEMPGQHGRVYSVAFSPDGSLFATANADSTASIWEAATGKQRALLRDHTNEVNSIAFAPDGRRLATVSDDGFAMVWDAATGRRLAAKKPLEGDSQNECLFVDNDRLLVLSRSHRLRCLAVDGLQERWNIEGAPNLPPGRKKWTTALAMTPDRKFAAVADGELIVIYDLTTRKMASILRSVGKPAWDPRSDYYKIGFIDDGKKLLVANQMIHIFDRSAGAEEPPIPFQKAVLTTFSFSEESRKLAVGRYSGCAEIWDVSQRKRLDLLSYHNDRIWDIAISSDGQRAVTGGNDAKTVLWDLRSPLADGCLILSDSFAGQVRLAFEPDSATVVAVSSMGEIGRFDLQSQRQVGVAKLDLLEKSSIDAEHALSRDGKFFAAIGATSLSVFATSNGRRLWEAPINGPYLNISFSSDSKRLFALVSDDARGNSNPRLSIVNFDPQTGKRAAASIDVSKYFRFAASTINDRLFAVAGDRIVESPFGGSVWQVPAGALPRDPEPVLSPDESLLVAARTFPNVRVFDVASKSCIAELKGNDRTVDLAAFSQDGKLLATSDRVGGTVQLWDLELKSKTVLLESGLKTVDHLVFAPDGSALVACGQNSQGSIRIFAWLAPCAQLGN